MWQRWAALAAQCRRLAEGQGRCRLPRVGSAGVERRRKLDGAVRVDDADRLGRLGFHHDGPILLVLLVHDGHDLLLGERGPRRGEPALQHPLVVREVQKVRGERLKLDVRGLGHVRRQLDAEVVPGLRARGLYQRPRQHHRALGGRKVEHARERGRPSRRVLKAENHRVRGHLALHHGVQRALTVKPCG